MDKKLTKAATVPDTSIPYGAMVFDERALRDQGLQLIYGNQGVAIMFSEAREPWSHEWMDQMNEHLQEIGIRSAADREEIFGAIHNIQLQSAIKAATYVKG